MAITLVICLHKNRAEYLADIDIKQAAITHNCGTLREIKTPGEHIIFRNPFDVRYIAGLKPDKILIHPKAGHLITEEVRQELERLGKL